MKKLIRYFIDFFKEQFNLPFFIFLSLFLTTIVTLNYTFDFENSILESYQKEWFYIFFSSTYYFFPLAITSIAYCYFYKKPTVLRNKSFWLLSLFAAVTLGAEDTFFFRGVFYFEELQESSTFVKKCVNETISSVFYLVPAAIYWYFKDRNNYKLYGFSAKEFSLSPYIIMYIIMIPLITWASYQDDFLATYPIYGMNWNNILPEYYDTNKWVIFGIYEFFYGSNFVFVEFFFRGFLVLAFARYLDKGAIFPMVALYCLFHFGKPMPEAVSSIFGGLALGILSYNTRSIYGGILIHLGVAWSMEIAAFIQHHFRGNY